MKTWEMILIMVVIAVIGVVVGYDIKRWNCDRVGMDADMFINGCVVRRE